MERQSASKETIASLIRNVGTTIEELYIALKQDFAIRNALDESMPHLYSVTHDIQTGIRFILMDIGVYISSDNVYALEAKNIDRC